MRETDVGEEHFTWSRRRRLCTDCGLILRLPSSLCILLILNLFVTAARLGVGGQIATTSLNCCGMRMNASKCWTNFACACDGCTRRAQLEKSNSSSENYYRLEFCTSFPLDEVLNAEFLRNRTFCREQVEKLQKADARANESYHSYVRILERIDCGENWAAHTYSATSTCRDCLKAYKDWICFTEVSVAILTPNDIGKHKRRPCVNLCETVLQKCPYLLPAVPSADNLVQIGDSAFNCIEEKEWKEEYVDSDDCLISDPLEKCEQNNDYTTSLQPTVMTTVSTSNLTTNSTNDGNR